LSGSKPRTHSFEAVWWNSCSRFKHCAERQARRAHRHALLAWEVPDDCHLRSRGWRSSTTRPLAATTSEWPLARGNRLCLLRSYLGKWRSPEKETPQKSARESGRQGAPAQPHTGALSVLKTRPWTCPRLSHGGAIWSKKSPAGAGRYSTVALCQLGAALLWRTKSRSVACRACRAICESSGAMLSPTLLRAHGNASAARGVCVARSKSASAMASY
jgi:hypothetical protein